MSRKRSSSRGSANPPAATTHYDALGVGAGATSDQIRTAYRRLAKQLHPDVSGSDDAQARFAEVAKAYEVLSDATRRREYDASMTASGEPGGGPTGARAHYTWRNVATGAAGGTEPTELDELYETFFVRHKPAE